MRAILLTLAVVAPVSAIFFGGGQSCGCSSCCSAPTTTTSSNCYESLSVCAPQPSCGCGGGGAPAAYAQPVSAPCRPRYIIVRPVESGGYESGPVGGGYNQGPIGGGGYVQAPIAGPSFSAPIQGPSYSAGPVAGPSYAASAPVAGPSYSAPVAGPSYSAPAQVAAPVASYASGGGEGAVAASAAAYASKTVNAEGKCSNKELRKILEKEIVPGDANESKRAVYRVANQQFSDANSEKGIDVICAPALISYRVATDFYCEYTKEDITCFAFQQA
ncbi:unnamed protein product [Bursaphelenchus okinawaensis]|uniref:Ground-like domain-containing protein n=1 Tax=Bursaphelenchus okinawaensis TaxID=465554 RepID=A0A811JSZ6_9BILA|nr:unnamed protein product [Bursaphelenchus okinawaensis]CAG9081142.1 unnamed protein product [Bursaphelenchus okinawaensis]